MKTIFTLILLTACCLHLNATIRYVSHTGSSTPPYTTWETAADSIQKCIDYSVDGDTIIVANGVYYESLIINKYLWLWGSSMDSTIIDGTGLAGTTVNAQADLNIENFNIIGKENTTSTNVIYISDFNGVIKECRLSNARNGLFLGVSSGKASNLIISDCGQGVVSFCAPDTCHPIITNSIILIDGGIGVPTGISIFDGGNPTITNNIIIGTGQKGIGISFSAKTMNIKNNIISGFEVSNIETRFTTDTAIVENNVTTHQTYYNSVFGSITAGSESCLTNNIFANNNTGIAGQGGIPESNYNLFWKNVITNTSGGVTIDTTDVLGDPMFVKDTIPTNEMNFDYHLQMFSPAIDTGDPNILDADGSRSDIGAYGGPGGSSYTYLNLPPRPPVNLNAEIEDSTVTLTWNKNSEADTAYYNVYRDTTANFTIDSTNFIGSTTDTFYIEPIPKQTLKLYYKVTCVDTKSNESEPSEEAVIILTVGMGEWKVVNEYVLYQNYPNPFNPSTKIGYKLIERGYVKLMVYDITGSLVSVLVNEVQEAGYYEVEFNASVGSRQSAVGNGLASGIYLYRIEIIGEGNIPRFSDLKKMILIK